MAKSTEEKLVLFEEKRKRYVVRAKHLYDLIPKVLDDLPAKSEFLTRYLLLEDTYAKHEDVIETLLELNTLVDDEYKCKNLDTLSQNFDKMYYAIKAVYPSVAPKPDHNQPLPPTSVLPTPAPIVSKPKLPQIQISTFDGTYEDFSSFKSLYDSLIHTHESLTNIEKFSYLKSLLSGPALNAIQGFPFDGAQYEVAYQTLVTRFSNKRVIASNICQKLFAIKPFTSENQLSQFLEVFNVNVESLKNLGIEDLSDFLLSFMALRLLDTSTRQAFENARKGKAVIPKYKDVLTFVEGRVAVASLMPSLPHYKSNPVAKPVPAKRAFVTNVTPGPSDRSKVGNTCPCCTQGHRISECSKFTSMPVKQRYEILKNHRLCFACLGPHSRSDCTSKYSCRHCGSKSHHSLLHVELEKPVEVSSNFGHSSFKGKGPQQILLGTAVVSVYDSYGKPHDVRALIDGGSTVTIVTKDLSNRLGLPKQSSQMRITGIGSGNPIPVCGVINCKVSSKLTPFNLTMEAVVLPQIATNLPSVPVANHIVRKLTAYKLADPTFHSPAPIHMLIGAQYYAQIMKSNEPIISGNPSIVPSQFGKLVLGIASSESLSSHHSFFLSSDETQLSNQLCKFWEVEEIHTPVPKNPLDVQCEDHFVATHQRDEEGRYVVRLPFRDNSPPDLGNNALHATHRLSKLENRLERKPENVIFKELYHDNFKDYIDNGHMVPVTPTSSYYLTHHGVCKESTTTRVRVVFSPAERASPSHSSLNEALLCGPPLQNNMNDIICNFRLQPIALTADIKQMYRAIKLHPDDWKYQQVVWRFSPSDPVQTYQITRVCFGVTSSPFHAIRVLKQLIQDEGHQFPLASRVLDEDSYVDDVCFGAASVDDARQLRDDLTSLLATAGFELRKWSCSNPAVLTDLSSDLLETPRKLGDVETIQVLGIQWDSVNDVFCYQIKPLPECTTKREVLSQIARTYDLPGFLSPVVIWMKIFMQQIWLLGVGWDDTLPSSMIDQWSNFVSDMPYLENIKIPRYILSTYVFPPEIVGFSDASSTAIACAVYLRVVCSDHRVLVHLIRSKTRVAPIRPVSIPRLELMASQLLSATIKSLEPLRARLRISDLYLFTDSTVVLSWLKTPPHKLKIFVANRVVQILDVTSPTQWSHVPTGENPADLASRGCLPGELVNHPLWWQGPLFLTQDHASWPKYEPKAIEEIPELKLSAVTSVAPVESLLLERFSSFSRAQRVIAWIIRFKTNCFLPPQDRLRGSLKVTELAHSERVMIRVTQTFHYSAILESLVKNEKLPVSFQQLSPYVDSSTQLLRVGGRIDNAPLPFDSRHPYLLPAKSHLAQLLVSHFHSLSLHGGARLVQSLIHAKFFIPGLRNLIRKTIFQCVPCYRFNGRPREPFMASLPMSRFHQGRAFIHCAVDLAGPFSIKDGHRRNSPIIKGWFCVFTCLAVRAVHLEPLLSLSTEAFLSCLDRFISRRGLPSLIYSDQGTNFKGAARTLDETYKFLSTNSASISDHLSMQNIQWTFNAPANPSGNGVCEIMVKATKRHLKFLLADRSLQFEEFTTILCRIEAILNSRPIGVPSSLSPEETPDCLTPGHFLIGAPLLSRPETDVIETPSNRLPRWSLLSQVCQHFWKRWRQEYLHSLIQRQKWSDHTDPVKVGDVVVLTLENTPPTRWPLARVEEVLPHTDGEVRIVRIRTPSGILTRPVRKLLVLPVCN